MEGGKTDFRDPGRRKLFCIDMFASWYLSLKNPLEESVLTAIICEKS